MNCIHYEEGFDMEEYWGAKVKRPWAECRANTSTGPSECGEDCPEYEEGER